MPPKKPSKATKDLPPDADKVPKDPTPDMGYTESDSASESSGTDAGYTDSDNTCNSQQEEQTNWALSYSSSKLCLVQDPYERAFCEVGDCDSGNVQSRHLGCCH